MVKDDKERSKGNGTGISFVNMNLGDIEEACRERGIKVTNRSSMEGKLIEALVEEYMK